MITIDPPIEELTLLEKYELLERLEASLPKPRFDPFSDEIVVMLKEREAAAERGENPSSPIDEAFERIRNRRK